MRIKYPEIGKRLKEIRKERGLTQKECLAPLGDITIQMLSSWENGHSFPTATYLIKISKFYDVSLDYIILGIKNDSNEYEVTEYDELLALLILLIESKKFNVNVDSISGDDKKFLSMQTSDETILNFIEKMERLKNSKDLYGEINYQKALTDLIESYKDKIN